MQIELTKEQLEALKLACYIADSQRYPFAAPAEIKAMNEAWKKLGEVKS